MNQSLVMKKNQRSRKFSQLLNKISKRTLDIGISSLGLIILSPILIYTSYRIKKEDMGPIFFKQKRSGLDNQTFEMYKFRSMKVDNHITGIYSKNKKDPYTDWQGRVPDDFVFKSASVENPNITSVGLIIRKYSIDELPQLINVLKGEMSIVGPRPEIIEITSHYDNKQKRRLEVKPGITGWAQVNGRSNMNHGKKIAYDIWYVENSNFWIDLKIIIMTFFQIFIGKDSV